jgi:hypothetical protein
MINGGVMNRDTSSGVRAKRIVTLLMPSPGLNLQFEAVAASNSNLLLAGEILLRQDENVSNSLHSIQPLFSPSCFLVLGAIHYCEYCFSSTVYRGLNWKDSHFALAK